MRARLGSTLTASGAPWAWGHTWTAQDRRWRVKVDPGPLDAPFQERLAVQHQLCQTLIESAGAGRWLSVHQKLWNTLLGPEALARPDARFGARLTLPLDDTDHTVRVYYNLAAFRRQCETLTDFWLAALEQLPVPHLSEVVARLPCGRGPGMLGTEYHPWRPLKAKWYVRPCGPVDRNALHEILENCGLQDWGGRLEVALSAWVGQQTTFPKGTLLYHLSTDASGQYGVNVYLDLRRLGLDEFEIKTRVMNSLAQLGLSRDSGEQDWSSDRPSLSALGVDQTGIRVNQSFEPRAASVDARPWPVALAELVEGWKTVGLPPLAILGR